MIENQIVSLLETEEGRSYLAKYIAEEFRKNCAYYMKNKFEDVFENRVKAPADVHQEVCMRPWDFI